eukprot:4339830-Pyramimonas_sp.AAC.1
MADIVSIKQLVADHLSSTSVLLDQKLSAISTTVTAQSREVREMSDKIESACVSTDASQATLDALEVAHQTFISRAPAFHSVPMTVSKRLGAADGRCPQFTHVRDQGQVVGDLSRSRGTRYHLQ